MFHFPAEREKKEPGGMVGRVGRNYTLIFHKCRLRSQLVPALQFSPQNVELSVIVVEKSPSAQPGSQQQISRLGKGLRSEHDRMFTS